MKNFLVVAVRRILTFALGACLQAISLPTVAETIAVKGRGDITLDRFNCEWANANDLIRRICYQTATNYLILNMGGNYLHYCRIAPGIVNGLRQSGEKERYFKQFIDGRYDCRVGGVPVG